MSQLTIFARLVSLSLLTVVVGGADCGNTAIEQCEAPSTCESCSSDFDCPDNERCTNGQCTVSTIVEPPADAGAPDVAPDVILDAGTDAGPSDAGTDAGNSDGGADAGKSDAGTDAGDSDGGADAGNSDAGTDAGDGDAGPDAGGIVRDGGVDVDAGPELGSCLNAISLDTAAIEGTNVAADYANTFTPTEASCGDFGADTVDIVFSGGLLAGHAIWVAEEIENGESIISIQRSGCDIDAPCEVVGNGAPNFAEYTADVDETVTVIVSYPSSMEDVPYSIQTTIIPPEDCDAAGDEDSDGLVNCDDPDCFGLPNVCDVELNCIDGADNDDDGESDCDDTDCSTLSICIPASGIHERFSSTTFDLLKSNLVFIPDETLAAGYSLVSNYAPNLGLIPGFGPEATQVLTLEDDTSVEVDLVFGTIPFGGESYGSIFVNDNGNITFDSGDTRTPREEDRFYEFRRVAGFYTDLDPSMGGTITVDQYQEFVVVTYADVPLFIDNTKLASFQILLATDGRVLITTDVTAFDIIEGEAYVGLSLGDPSGRGPYPAAVDLYVQPTVINEVNYNPAIGGREFVELKGHPGSSLDAFALTQVDAQGVEVFSLDLSNFSIADDGYFVIGNTGANVDVSFAELEVLQEDALDNVTATLTLKKVGPGGIQQVIDSMVYGAGDIVALARWNTSVGRHVDGRDTNTDSDFVAGWFASPGQRNFSEQPDTNVFDRYSSAVQGNENFPLAIPDNDVTGGPTATLAPGVTGSIAAIYVGVDVRHTYRGDLTITLTSPGGNSFVLHNATGEGNGGNNPDVTTIFNFGATGQPSFEALDALVGTVLTVDGVWQLRVIDSADNDVGTLDDFVLFLDVAG